MDNLVIRIDGEHDMKANLKLKLSLKVDHMVDEKIIPTLKHINQFFATHEW